MGHELGQRTKGETAKRDRATFMFFLSQLEHTRDLPLACAVCQDRPVSPEPTHE